MKHYTSTLLKSEPKPKAAPNFCFDCGKKLRGKYKYQMEWEGHLRTFHKSCAEWLLIDMAKERERIRNGWEGY